MPRSKITLTKDLELDMQPRGDCEECDWTTGPAANTQHRAFAHARARRHRVRVISERIEYWQPEVPI